MEKLVTFLLLTTTFSGFAQTAPILTKERNAIWIQELRQQELPEQLKMIRTRWQQDAEVHYEVAASPHEITPDNRASPKCRPLYLINHKDEDQIIFPANPSSGMVAAVSEFLSTDNVYEVKVASESIQLIYGQRGSCGVIYITVEKAIFEMIGSELSR